MKFKVGDIVKVREVNGYDNPNDPPCDKFGGKVAIIQELSFSKHCVPDAIYIKFLKCQNLHEDHVNYSNWTMYPNELELCNE